MFVKLGQVLSTRADLLPAGAVAELSRLQDQVASAPAEAVMALLEAEIGRPVAEVFASLDPQPIAAASTAQAYRRRLRGGEPVVVKVQRPGIAESSSVTCWCWPRWLEWPRLAPPGEPSTG